MPKKPTATAAMTSDAFADKWGKSKLRERQGYQEHWRDVCLLLGQPTPSEVDTQGSEYCFERGAAKNSGGDGWADVWWRKRFGVEYKGKHKDLKAAYDQLNEYREALESPPLLIVTDMDRFEVHTNFTGTVKHIYSFDLAAIAGGGNVLVTPQDDSVPTLTAVEVLRNCFTAPDKLKPTLTAEFVTKEAAASFARIAESMQRRKVDPRRAAHFLMKTLFSLFAEDIGLLPEKIFERIVNAGRRDPEKLASHMKRLFQQMNTEGGGEFDLSEAELKKRTLTNLYNARPTWLHNAHLALDSAVLAAYGWLESGTGQEPSPRPSPRGEGVRIPLPLGEVGAKRRVREFRANQPSVAKAQNPKSPHPSPLPRGEGVRSLASTPNTSTPRASRLPE